jgi:hypothetical protein
MRFAVCTLMMLVAATLFAREDNCDSGKQMGDHSTLAFRALPSKPLFKRGEDVVLVLSIQNESDKPIFVSRLAGKDFVDIKLTGPGRKQEAPWVGDARIDGRTYSPGDFAVLESGKRLNANRIISVKNGQGFLINKPGRYFLTASYSLAPPDYFAPLAVRVTVPNGCFASRKATFCLESCATQAQ